ncbi:MAG: DUF5069 domain-containing protein [Nitrospinaceae bacterium]|nr:DUF5069 domain-containing protein [Nitrospinaceae bacterium]NIR54814.1 DUF5069 domain-containing protein [Nitrospinaceae bacterium]NIS85239.1 DUF5069 domain-containing protein [Nitrospinaceae bacterium]NIT82052.1 DUF5069 domain-containing protein [Nitrospinaceae bacterium]NIU44313.1 DUF5069 domain-containing protein [Nitrospinaceae bacterium]
MNLTKEFPRSPRERMAGLAHIPRMIDKARAAGSNQLGEYIFPCPLDNILLEFLGVKPEVFQQKACDESEELFTDWIGDRCQNRTLKEKEEINAEILNNAPNTPEKREAYQKILSRVDASRKDITTWVELIDLEEGRL